MSILKIPLSDVKTIAAAPQVASTVDQGYPSGMFVVYL